MQPLNVANVAYLSVQCMTCDQRLLSCMQAVAKSSDTAAILEQLQKKRVRVQPFLDLLVASLCRHFGSSPHCRLLEQLICQIELSESHYTGAPCLSSVSLTLVLNILSDRAQSSASLKLVLNVTSNQAQ